MLRPSIHKLLVRVALILSDETLAIHHAFPNKGHVYQLQLPNRSSRTVPLALANGSIMGSVLGVHIQDLGNEYCIASSGEHSEN